MKQIFVVILIACTACGTIDPVTFASLIQKQPQVISVVPTDGADSYTGTAVEVRFSSPIDPKTITSKSFLVTAVSEEEVDIQFLWEQVSKEKVEVVEGGYEISDDGLSARFIASKPFPSGVRCGVLVTPHVLSSDRLPLNQTPGEGPNPFFSSFYVKGESVPSSGEMQILSVPSLSRPSYLRLNEIFYDAVGSDAEGNLFIELLGEPERSIADYQMIMVSGDDGRIVDTIKIPKEMQTNQEGFFVIADAVTGQPGTTKVLGADWVTNFDPPNGPDCIQLLNPEGELVDVVGYGSPLVLRAENNLFCYQGAPVPDAPSGQSLSRDDFQNWVINAGPSPGKL